MKISVSSVSMVSRHQAAKETSKSEFLHIWNTQGSSFGEVSGQATPQQLDRVELTKEAQEQLAHMTEGTGQTVNEAVYQLSEEDQRKIELIQKLLEQLTGKKIKFIVPKQILLKTQDPSLSIRLQKGQNRQGVGWGLIYQKSVTTRESEQTSFAATATVRTEDGRQIEVNLDLSLSRQYESSESISIRAGDAKRVDPLVINFGAASATVTDQKVSFDLNADGSTEQISFTGAGSGFLALDKNKDGLVNDGGELFGPESGNGFNDLAAYDQDQNGWIDENDPIYNDLQIWSKDAAGNDSLVAIGQQGIGAIYLGYVSTEFALKDAINNSNAQIQKTGIFLREDGTAGTVQHVDLIV